jgi:hypothetical protein
MVDAKSEARNTWKGMVIQKLEAISIKGNIFLRKLEARHLVLCFLKRFSPLKKLTNVV